MDAALWIAVLDDETGRLFRGRPIRRSGRLARVRMDPIESIENTWRALDGKRPAASDEQLGGDRRLELRSRYALDLVEWLAGARKRLHIETLDVLAVPRLESLLRRFYSGALGPAVMLQRAEVGGLGRHDLELAPTILEMAQAAEQGSRRAS